MSPEIFGSESEASVSRTEAVIADVYLSPARGFVLAALGLASGAALLAGWMPLGFAIVTVFLFAGPHNWIEARYFLSRLPARWGKLRGYFLLAFGGVIALTTSFAALPWLSALGTRGTLGPFLAYGIWNSLLVGWLALLMQMRSRQNPRRDWSGAWPAACVLLSLVWIAPPAWVLCFMLSHPLIALWILDRELRRGRRELLGAYHFCLLCLPIFVGVLCWRLGNSPQLPGEDNLTVQIAQQAGADSLRSVSTRLVVAVHSFLQMIHYGVWLLAIPLIGLRSVPWRVDTIPLARRTPVWRLAVVGLLGGGLVAVFILWASFLADYPATRNVYFTLSMAHVLAEFPFLLRTL
jgi:hypothetical protein